MIRRPESASATPEQAEPPEGKTAEGKTAEGDTAGEAAVPPDAGDETRGHLASLARGGLMNLVGALVTALTGLALTVTITRTVPKTTAGVYFAVTSLFLLLMMIGRLGSGTGLIYFVARFRALGRSREIRTVLRLAIRPVVVASAVIGVGLFVAAPWLAPLVVRGHDPLVASYLRQVALFLPLGVLADMYQAVSRGYGTMRPTTLLEKIARPAVQLPLVAVAAVFGGGLIGLGWAVPYLPAAVLSVWWVRALARRRTPEAADPSRPEEAAPEPQPVRALRREYWSYSVPRAFVGIAQVALQRLDVILVGVLRGPVEAAIYTAASRFLVIGQLGNQAIGMAVQPQIVSLLATEDRRGANAIYRGGTAWLVLMNWPLYLFCAVFAPQILAIFGSGYQTGRAVMFILAASMLIATACGSVGTILSMAGRSSWNVANIVASLVVNVGVDVLLIPPLGILGAAIGWAAAILINNLVPLYQVARHLHLHPFGRATIAAMALAGACFGVLPIAALVLGTALLPDRSLLVTIPATAVGLLVFVAGAWRYRRLFQLDVFLRTVRRRRRAGGGAVSGG